jgi:hypothetical protein
MVVTAILLNWRVKWIEGVPMAGTLKNGGQHGLGSRSFRRRFQLEVYETLRYGAVHHFMRCTLSCHDYGRTFPVAGRRDRLPKLIKKI